MLRLILCLSALVTACGSAAPRVRAGNRPPPAAVPRGDAPAPPPAPDPQVVAWKEELDRLRDPKSSFAAVDRSALPKAAPTRMATRGPLPLSRVASVSAYAYGFSRPSEAKCTVVRPDGQPCDDVVAPGATLSVEQMQKLLDSLRTPPAPAPVISPDGGGYQVRRFTTHCEFEPHHAFVLRDAAGSPLASLEVCFTCGEWLAHPPQANLGGKAPRGMWPAEKELLQQLCVDLKLGGCFVGDDAKMAAVRSLRGEESAQREATTGE